MQLEIDSASIENLRNYFDAIPEIVTKLPNAKTVPDRQHILLKLPNGTYRCYIALNGIWNYIWNIGEMWDDLRSPATGVNPSGTPSPPSIDANDGGLLFANSPAVNIIAIMVQFPHTYKEGTNVEPHLHWTKTTSAAGTVGWEIRYSWANPDGVFPAFSSWIPYSSVGVSDANTADKHAIVKFPTINGSDKLISSMMKVNIRRNGGTYAANAKLLEFDIHHRIDTSGSEQEYIKRF